MANDDDAGYFYGLCFVPSSHVGFSEPDLKKQKLASGFAPIPAPVTPTSSSATSLPLRKRHIQQFTQSENASSSSSASVASSASVSASSSSSPSLVPGAPAAESGAGKTSPPLPEPPSPVATPPKKLAAASAASEHYAKASVASSSSLPRTPSQNGIPAGASSVRDSPSFSSVAAPFSPNPAHGPPASPVFPPPPNTAAFDWFTIQQFNLPPRRAKVVATTKFENQGEGEDDDNPKGKKGAPAGGAGSPTSLGKRGKRLSKSGPTSPTPVKKAKVEEEQLYCLCRKPDTGEMMIACDRCDEWFHASCVGMSEDKAEKIQKYVCDECKEDMQDEPRSSPTLGQGGERKCAWKECTNMAKEKSKYCSRDCGIKQAKEALKEKDTIRERNMQKRQEKHRAAAAVLATALSSPPSASEQSPIEITSPGQSPPQPTPSSPPAPRSLSSPPSSSVAVPSSSSSSLPVQSPILSSQQTSAADAEDRRSLELLEEKKAAARRALQLLEEQEKELEAAIKRAQTLSPPAADSNTSSAPTSSTTATEGSDTTTSGSTSISSEVAPTSTSATNSPSLSTKSELLDCVTCGQPVASKNYTRHLENCNEKGSTRRTSSSSSSEASETRLCGCPSQEFGLGYCDRLLRDCPKHFHWEQKRTSQLQQEKSLQHKALSSLADEEDIIRARMNRRQQAAQSENKTIVEA